MNKLKSLMFVALACFVMSACTTSNQSKIDDLRNLQEEVADNYKDWSTDDWREFLEEYEDLESSLSDSNLNAEEKKEFAKIKKQLRKYILRGKAHVTVGDVADALGGAGEAIGDAWNEAFDDDDWDDVRDALDDAGDALGDALDGALDDARDAVNDALNDAREAAEEKVQDALGSAADAVRGLFGK